jgi:transcription elongation factor Elf1
MDVAGSQSNPTTPPAVQAEFAGTPVRCPKCEAKLCVVKSVTRLNLSVHCAFCGHDFGVTIHAPGAPVETPETANPPAGGWR